MPFLPEIAIGAIGAAAIAGTLALASLVGGKENKTSEFRQAWIDALRNDTAKLISNANVLDGAIGVTFTNREAIWNAGREYALGFTEAAAGIKMRLNPDEDTSKMVLRTVSSIESLLGFDGGNRSGPASQPPQGRVQQLTADLINDVNRTLKRDWIRVKRGEPKYQFAVWGVVLLLISSVSAISYSAIFTHENSKISKKVVKHTSNRRTYR